MIRLLQIYFLFIVCLHTLMNAQYLRDDAQNIVFDTATGLIWQDPEQQTNKDIKSALEYCDDLEIGFYKNWRLPSYNELYSIVDLTKTSPTLNAVFKERAEFYYWVSTLYVDDFPWAIDFRDGASEHGLSPANLNNVRCVHNF